MALMHVNHERKTNIFLELSHVAQLTCCQLVHLRGEVEGDGHHGGAREEDDGGHGADHHAGAAELQILLGTPGEGRK